LRENAGKEKKGRKSFLPFSIKEINLTTGRRYRLDTTARKGNFSVCTDAAETWVFVGEGDCRCWVGVLVGKDGEKIREIGRKGGKNFPATFEREHDGLTAL